MVSMFRKAALVAMLGSLVSAPCSALAQDTSAQAECDRLAANPDDPENPVGLIASKLNKSTASQAISACEQAMARVAYELGGIVAKYNEIKWVGYYRLAAQHGNSQAQSELDKLDETLENLSDKESLEKLNEAIKNLKARISKPATKEDIEAGEQTLGRMAYQLGRALITGDEELKGVALYLLAAEHGYALAQVELGSLYDLPEYFKGQPHFLSVRNNEALAVEWYRKAAENGNAEAQYRLGFAFELGLRATKNVIESVAWYRKAVEQGHAKAEYRLAMLYLTGEVRSGTPEERKTEGMRLLRLAAEHGDEEAKRDLPAMEKIHQ